MSEEAEQDKQRRESAEQVASIQSAIDRALDQIRRNQELMHKLKEKQRRQDSRP